MSGIQVIPVPTLSDQPLFSYKGTVDASLAVNLPTNISVGNYYKVSVAGNFESSGLISPNGAVFLIGDAIVWSGSAWDKLDNTDPAGAVSASETIQGIVELATAAETTTGTDVIRAVHPAGLKVELDKKLVNTKIQNDQTGSTYTVLVSDADSAVTNKGNIAALVHTLPDGLTVLGKSFLFIKIANQNVTITASSGDQIYNGVANGNVTNITAGEVGASIILSAYSDTGSTTAIWIIESFNGTWTVI